MRTFALIAAAAILICHFLAIAGLAARPLHYDENEYMHSSWLMAAGKTIYRDFFEDHSPHLGVLLQTVLPHGDLEAVDVRAWTMRARLLCGFLGTVAAGAIMLFAWRMTRAPAAPVVAAAMLLASPQIWARGLSDIRAEAPTLALFWWGLVLLTWSGETTLAQSLRAGLGIGLMFAANVWNPKWPLECVIVGALYLHFLWRVRRQPRMLITAVASAVFIAMLALLPVVLVTTVRDYVFFSFRFRGETIHDFTSNPFIVQFFRRVPVWASAAPQHRWYVVVAAIVIALIAMRIRKPAEPRLAWIAIALSISALLEVRFVYWYPYLWAQYLVMIATTASLVYALLAAHSRTISYVAMTLATIFALARLVPMAATAIEGAPPSRAAYWQAQRALQLGLQKGETVWISPPRHPVAAFDASYYWYNFRESAPSAIHIQSKYPQYLPPIGFRDLPPCTLNAKYVELGDWMPYLDRVCECAQDAFNAGKLAPTPYLGIFEVTTQKRDAPWLQRTRGFWSDLCRRQEVFLRGGTLNITP